MNVSPADIAPLSGSNVDTGRAATAIKGFGANYLIQANIVRRLDPSLASEIDALARVAIEPNAFHESWMLAAALDHLDAPELTLVSVRDQTGRLTGIFPLEAARYYHGIPLRNLRSWKHDYLFLSSPLIAADQVTETIDALLDWIGLPQAPASLLDLVAIRADGPIAATLMDGLARRPRYATRIRARQRALLDLSRTVDTGMSGKHRKELRRQARRLGELGKLEYRALDHDESPQAWIERFLALEARGWKGKAHTALASQTGSQSFFTTAVEQAQKRGQLQMLEMTLDGEPIAVKCNFISREGAFMFKIAYDERYAQYSPGLLLELFNIDYLKSLADTDLAWADSCARSQHFMIERLWPDRRAIGDYTICGGSLISRAIIRNRERLRRARKSMSAWLEGT